MPRKVAIIDLGSNSVRMLVMRLYRDGSYKMVDQAKEMVRLSEHMGEEQTLKTGPIERTIFTLKLFRKLAEAHRVDRVIAVATAAVRSARNRRDFLEEVKKETGFDFEVIPGEQEAYYDYLAVINTIDIDDCMIMDVGGASTELVLVRGRELREAVSVPFGAVLLAERFPDNSDDAGAPFGRLGSFVAGRLRDIPWLPEANGLPIVGLGGSLRTVAKIDKRIKGSPLEGLHNYRLSADEAGRIINMVLQANLEERMNIPGLDRERADIIPAGLSIIKTLMQLIRSNTLIISGNGLREGVFFKQCLDSGDGTKGVVKDVLYHSVNNILKNYEMNRDHCYHVQKLALALFDQTARLHNMGAAERKILATGALLHDIGVYVNYYNHHKHGFYLVLNSRLNGLTNKELVMCAYIVAMHTNEDLKQTWHLYGSLLDKADRETIKRLSLFVRIAEQLDRSEYGSVADLVCQVSAEQVQVMVRTKNHPELEIAEALKCRKHFEKLLKRKLGIVKN